MLRELLSAIDGSERWQDPATAGDDAPTFTGGTALVKVDSDESQEKLERILEKTMDACPVGRLFEAAKVEVKTTLRKESLLPS